MVVSVKPSLCLALPIVMLWMVKRVAARVHLVESSPLEPNSSPALIAMVLFADPYVIAESSEMPFYLRIGSRDSSCLAVEMHY
jgi:hypothetical protein